MTNEAPASSQSPARAIARSPPDRPRKNASVCLRSKPPACTASAPTNRFSSSVLVVCDSGSAMTSGGGAAPAGKLVRHSFNATSASLISRASRLVRPTPSSFSWSGGNPSSGTSPSVTGWKRLSMIDVSVSRMVPALTDAATSGALSPTELIMPTPATAIGVVVDAIPSGRLRGDLTNFQQFLVAGQYRAPHEDDPSHIRLDQD